MRCIIIYSTCVRMLIAYLHAFISSTYAYVHTYMQAYTHTHRHVQHNIFPDLICCPDEPHACILLQMLAPSHRAQVLFQSGRLVQTAD